MSSKKTLTRPTFSVLSTMIFGQRMNEEDEKLLTMVKTFEQS